jgi:hypothetical protein
MAEMRLFLLVALGALMVLAASAPAASATTWAGSCQMTGQIDLLEPYHLVPENRDYVGRASGTCTGTLNGKPYDGPGQSFLDGRMDKPMSCEAGVADHVPGWIYFGSGSPDDVDAPDTTLDLYMDESHLGTVLGARIQGAFNGEAAALIQFTDADQAAFERCAGAGSDQIHFTMKTQSLTTLYG